jgi:ferritin-like metal-binding protein YciE
MSDPRQLFLHELGDILYAENMLVKTLPKLAKEATDADLRTGFETHLEQTRKHVDNVKKVFETLGEKAKAEKCPGIDGITEEHDEFMKEEQPTPDICDMFLTGAGARAEHYEIAAYTGLVISANALGEPEAARLLRENLAEEQEALKRLEAAAMRLSQASAPA